MKICGEVLVELLEAYGIDTVFGIPGVHTVELYRRLSNTKLRHITPRHEQGAGFMADGYARASGQPAACFIITGPGMTNIATAMAQALADSVPMLVISSVNSSHELGLGEGRLHELPDQSALVSGVSVFSHRVLRADELPSVIARAFAVFDGARPGPVHIELPLDVITARAGFLSRTPYRTITKSAPDATAIQSAAALLHNANDPMIVLGGGCAGASDVATDMVERLGMPTILTINANGVLQPDNPHNLGTSLSVAPVLSALENADVVLAVGTELGETDTLLFYKKLQLRGQLIRIDIDSQQLIRNALPAVGICSDAGLAMQALCEILPEEPLNNKGVERAAQLRGLLAENIRSDYRMHGRFFRQVAETLPDVIIVGDSTQPIYGGNLTYASTNPRSWFNSSTGYGTLGYGLPAALGAKLARADRPVVAVIGDGGIQFTIGELATAVELQLGIPILLWNNRGYGEIKNYMQERDIPPIGVDIYTPDFLAIARGFGCAAIKIESAPQLNEVLLAAHRAKVPTIIEIDDAVAQAWWGEPSGSSV